MPTDWKDALAALAASGDVPQAAPEAPDNTVEESPAAKSAPLHIAYERKGRKGKPATIIYGFDCSDDELQHVAADLKKRIGVGGSARGGEILLQGDWRQRAAELLREMGFKVK